jgi:hypothetical protein
MSDTNPQVQGPDALNNEIEHVLRHLIARAEELAGSEDTLLGAGAQLVYSAAGVRYMSLKSEIDQRVHELVTAQALLKAAREQCAPQVQLLLASAETLVAQALAMTETTALN